ncbi:hypothetical protein DJ68_03640 [Halorubrum sp. C3]|nr:hypothetical protein DJ68_03640 [Halorubrum sp. C3]
MSWNIANLLKKKDGNRPPVDILSLVAGLVVFAVISFSLAFLVPFSGPAIEAGSSYQILAGLQWVVAGAIFIFLAIRIYQQRRIGWYGTLAVAVFAIIRATFDSFTFGLVSVVYIAIPLVVIIFLLIRRGLFLNG